MATVSEKIIDRIIADLKSRSGLGDAWYEVAKEQRAYIRREWIEIYHEEVDKVLNRKPEEVVEKKPSRFDQW